MTETPITSPKKYPCLLVDQPIGTFFVSSVRADEILPLLSVERRGLSEEARQRVQRSLDPKRQAEIAKYALQSDATFPTSVTLSANSDYVHLLNSNSELVVGVELDSDRSTIKDGQEILEVDDGDIRRWFGKIPEGQSIAQIIDGQHRVEGLRYAAAHTQIPVLSRFQLTFAFMFDLSPEEMAKIFVTINSTQRKVDSSHIADLFGLSTKRSPQRTCHLIAAACNSTDGGPFKDGLKMLGKRNSKSEMLSQGSFCKYLVKLISKNPEEDERRIQAGDSLAVYDGYPLRDYFLNGKDEVILRIIENFFGAAADVFSEGWFKNPYGYLLRKTVGFSALMQLLSRVLPVALEHGNASKDVFLKFFEAIAAEYPVDSFSVDRFSSSEAEATKMCNQMFDAVSQDLHQIFLNA